MTGRRLDFSDPRHSRGRAEDFRFDEVPLAAFEAEPSLGALFLASPTQETR